MGDYCLTSSVTEMLNTSQWNSLNHRRNVLRLQMMYKITHRIVHLKLPEYIAYSHGITRGHDYKLTIPPTRIDVYKHVHIATFQPQSHYGINYQMKQ